MILHLAVLIQICILIRQDNKNVLNRRDLIGLVDQTAIGRPVRLPAFFTSARWGCFLAKKQCCWRQFCIVVWRAAHAARGEDGQCAGVLGLGAGAPVWQAKYKARQVACLAGFVRTLSGSADVQDPVWW